MIALLVAVVLAKSQTPLTVRQNRITFYNALLQVKEGWTKAQVQQLLGPPDDVWKQGEPGQGPLYYHVDEVWAYGSDRHLSIPTFGEVQFSGFDRVAFQPAWSFDPPPPMSVIGDAELARHLRYLSRWMPDWEFTGRYDPLVLIRISNYLRPLSKEKELAVMLQYSRVRGTFMDEDLFLVVRLMFKPRDPPGFFKVHYIGDMDPVPPKDLRQWPDFPLIEEDGVPFPVLFGFRIAGGLESFRSYVGGDSTNWVPRRRPLRPPDDPFPAYIAATRSQIWTSLARPLLPEQDPLGNPVEGLLLTELLKLIRTAWPMPDSKRSFADVAGYERYHAAFLATHSHWDARSQMYVRAGGSVIADASPVH